MRAVEYFAESILVNTIFLLSELFPGTSDNNIDTNYPKFNAIRCTRFAEFNFFIDKVKVGKLQCVNANGLQAIMGYEANPAIMPGNYYLSTNSGMFYAVSNYGTTPYLNNNATNEEHGFQ